MRERGTIVLEGLIDGEDDSREKVVGDSDRSGVSLFYLLGRLLHVSMKKPVRIPQHSLLSEASL